jgi:hypothetical protein
MLGIHPHAEFFLITHIVLFSVLYTINNHTPNAKNCIYKKTEAICFGLLSRNRLNQNLSVVKTPHFWDTLEKVLHP